MLGWQNVIVSLGWQEHYLSYELLKSIIDEIAAAEERKQPEAIQAKAKEFQQELDRQLVKGTMPDGWTNLHITALAVCSMLQRLKIAPGLVIITEMVITRHGV